MKRSHQPRNWSGQIDRRELLPRLGPMRVVLAIALAAPAQGCVVRPAAAVPGPAFNRGTNATWLGVEWVSAPHGEEEIIALASDLASRQIVCTYVFASYLRPEGKFAQTYFHAGEFTHALKDVQPALDVQA